MKTIDFNLGDYVYYNRCIDSYTFETIPCEIIKINKKTVNLSDGYQQYNNIRFSSIFLQTQ